MDRSSPTIGHGTGNPGRASSTGSPILHVKAAKPQLQWQAQQQQQKQKAAVGSVQTSSGQGSTGGVASPSLSSSMNKYKERTSNCTGNSPQSHSSKSTHSPHSSHKIKHHHHLSGERHKHHKHRSPGLGVKSSSPGSSLGKHRHKRHHHRSTFGGQRNEHNQHHMDEQKPSEDKKEVTSPSQNISNGSAPASPTGADSGNNNTGVFRAARELAQLRADLVEIGVDPGGDEGGSNPATPSGRKGPGRGRGRQPMQYEEVLSWYDEENGITYTKGGQYCAKG